jgi:hypothetical protein
MELCPEFIVSELFSRPYDRIIRLNKNLALDDGIFVLRCSVVLHASHRWHARAFLTDHADGDKRRPVDAIAVRAITVRGLTSAVTGRSFNPSSATFVALLHEVPGPWRALSLVALRSTRASTRIIPASDHSARTVSFVSIGSWPSDQRRRSTRERLPQASSPTGQSRCTERRPN